MEQSGSKTAPTVIDGLPLDLRNSSGFKCIVSELPKLRGAGVTHVDSRFIAARTDQLRSLSLFPLTPRWSTLQISAQDNPRSTYP